MKRLILFSSVTLLLASTFDSDSPPGWFQQTLPVNDFINDIFFLDSSSGWVVTDGRTSTNDTGYIMKTTNGGNNWSVQYNQPMKLNVVQFLDNNTGYVGGGSGSGTARVFKTTNSGTNWAMVSGSLLGFGDLEDLFFVNPDTGWVCDMNGFGGLTKTTNGGVNWMLQLDDSYLPKDIYFVNKDTGWVISNEPNTRLYKTTNSGTNWNLHFTFTSPGAGHIFFITRDTGWATGGTTGIMKTITGGSSWVVQTNPGTVVNGSKLFFINNKRGWIGISSNRMLVTSDGLNWGYQNTPAFTNFSVFFTDTTHGWGGTSILIHTTDGGGSPIGIIYANSEVHDYKLNQNFPNPFNPTTIIYFHLFEKSTVELKVFNILGEEVAEMIDDDHFTAGVYQFGFDATEHDLPSGVYFYRLIAKSETSDKIFVDTKKMILIK